MNITLSIKGAIKDNDKLAEALGYEEGHICNEKDAEHYLIAELISTMQYENVLHVEAINTKGE